VKLLQLKPGSSVADVGAGSGELSMAIAKRVEPQGNVYSTEINRALLDKIRNSAQKVGAQNVIPVVGKEHDTGLPQGCCDAIFLREINLFGIACAAALAALIQLLQVTWHKGKAPSTTPA
jgi:precorrin-6B methylase 2